MKKSNLYTKTGDSGSTSLVGGIRVSKLNPRIEAYGTVDELNSHLGYLTSILPEGYGDIAFIHMLQHNLFSVGSYLATDTRVVPLNDVSVIKDAVLAELEAEIDKIDNLLPALHSFVLPGGSREGAYCHICRTVCRRAERRILSLQSEVEISKNVLCFMNRLSDYLFVLSRKFNNEQKKEEINWQKG